MSQLVIFILTTTSALAALRRVEGTRVEVEAPSTSYTIKTTADYATMKPSTTPNAKHKDRWLMYVSAGPTVFIFIVCVIAISVKNCSGEDKYPKEENRMLSPTATSVPTSPMSLLKQKPKIINEVYDKMLEQFKDDKSKNKSFVGRKCSQIHIQGVESGSPKSLARKHIIIGQLSGNKEDEVIAASPKTDAAAGGEASILQIEEVEEDDNPITTLVRNSTTAFIGEPAVREMTKNESMNSEDTIEIKDTVRGILRTSIDDLTEADRRTFCDEINEVLLPEDLEEAFKDFEYWAESYA